MFWWEQGELYTQLSIEKSLILVVVPVLKSNERSLLTAQHPFQREWQGNCFLVALIQLNDKIAEFEQEKFEMQKQHTQNIQELLDETNQRLQKMETEYNQQNAATVSETCIVLSIFAK